MISTCATQPRVMPFEPTTVPAFEGGRPAWTVREDEAPGRDLCSRKNEVGTILPGRHRRWSESRPPPARALVSTSAWIGDGDGSNGVAKLRGPGANYS